MNHPIIPWIERRSTVSTYDLIPIVRLIFISPPNLHQRSIVLTNRIFILVCSICILLSILPTMHSFKFCDFASIFQIQVLLNLQHLPDFVSPSYSHTQAPIFIWRFLLCWLHGCSTGGLMESMLNDLNTDYTWMMNDDQKHEIHNNFRLSESQQPRKDETPRTLK